MPHCWKSRVVDDPCRFRHNQTHGSGEDKGFFLNLHVYPILQVNTTPGLKNFKLSVIVVVDSSFDFAPTACWGLCLVLVL